MDPVMGVAIGGAIVGLFVAMFTVAKMVDTYCKSCRSFGLELQSKSVDESFRFSGKRYVHVYAKKCRKCGAVVTDQYESNDRT